MTEQRPDFLTQGESARLFPVLSTVSTEGRATSILLACLSKINKLSQALLISAGRRVGVQTRVDTYTQIVPKKSSSGVEDRPDGLIVLKSSRSGEWRAFVEAKIGKTELDADQIERYRALAKENAVDCVITISNQFTSAPDIHPLEAIRNKKRGVPVIHWSWMRILTAVGLLIDRDEVKDRDQRIILQELHRFLAHEDSGVRGFDRMPGEWTKINRHVSSGGEISKKSLEAKAVLDAWHQEINDLSLILSRSTDTRVKWRLPRKHMGDPELRQKDELNILSNDKKLCASFGIPDAAAPLDVVADLARRCIEVGMTLYAPDKTKTSTRIKWLLRQIRQEDDTPNLHVRIHWPGKSSSTLHLVSDLREDVDVAGSGKENLTPTGFHLFEVRQLEGRFAQQINFVKDLEKFVSDFYGTYGQNLSAWTKPAPKLKDNDPVDISSD